jgi:hypothetical protein
MPRRALAHPIQAGLSGSELAEIQHVIDKIRKRKRGKI